MKRLFLSLLISVMVCAAAIAQSNPTDFKTWLIDLKIDKQYAITRFLNPYFLVADFNGDGTEDYAVLIFQKKTMKKGILIIDGHNSKYFILGAGNALGNGGDDFKWAGGWNIYKKKYAYISLINNEGDLTGSKKVILSRPGIYVFDLEEGKPNSGGIIYWNRGKYVWLQQGE